MIQLIVPYLYKLGIFLFLVLVWGGFVSSLLQIHADRVHDEKVAFFHYVGGHDE